MAGRLLFVILMYSCGEIQVEALLPPTLIVYPPVITETETVTLDCQTPSSVSVSQCYFYTLSGGPVRAFSCLATLTGSELLKMAYQSSPAEVKVKCAYYEKYQSPDSEASSVTIRTLLPPKLTVNPAVITETDSVTLNCQPPSSVSVSQCYFYTVGRESHTILSCMETRTGSELLNMASLSSPAEVKVKCYYSVKVGERDFPSPHSDTASITIHSDTASITIHSPKPQMSVQHFDGDYVLFTCSLPGPADHDTRCNLYFGEATILTGRIWKTMTSTNQWFCQFTVTVADLLTHLRSVQQSDASCDYTLGSDPNSLSPRSDRYSLTDIVKKESSTVPTKKPFTTTTDSVKRESSMASTRAPVTTTKDLMDGPGASTTPVKPAEDIVEKETDMTLTDMPPSTVTTGLTDSKLHASTPAPPTKQPPGVTAAGPSYTRSFISASLTNANSFPVTPPNPTSETWTWKLVVAAACFGGVVFLALALLCAKRRTGRCFKKRTRVNVSDDLMCMKNLDPGGSLPAGNDEAYSVITSVPAADCPAGSQKCNGQESHNEDLDVYHVYATVSEEPHPSALTDMVYSTLQAH